MRQRARTRPRRPSPTGPCRPGRPRRRRARRSRVGRLWSRPPDRGCGRGRRACSPAVNVARPSRRPASRGLRCRSGCPALPRPASRRRWSRSRGPRCSTTRSAAGGRVRRSSRAATDLRPARTVPGDCADRGELVGAGIDPGVAVRADGHDLHEAVTQLAHAGDHPPVVAEGDTGDAHPAAVGEFRGVLRPLPGQPVRGRRGDEPERVVDGPSARRLGRVADRDPAPVAEGDVPCAGRAVLSPRSSSSPSAVMATVSPTAMTVPSPAASARSVVEGVKSLDQLTPSGLLTIEPFIVPVLASIGPAMPSRRGSAAAGAVDDDCSVEADAAALSVRSVRSTGSTRRLHRWRGGRDCCGAGRSLFRPQEHEASDRPGNDQDGDGESRDGGLAPAPVVVVPARGACGVRGRVAARIGHAVTHIRSRSGARR